MGKGRHVAKSEEGRFDDPRSTNGTPRQVNLDSNPNLPPPAPVLVVVGVMAGVHRHDGSGVAHFVIFGIFFFFLLASR